jgi:hypothetical protein
MRASKRKVVLFTTLAAVVAVVLLNSTHKTAPSPAARPVSTPQPGEAVAAQLAAKIDAKPLALPERPALGEPAGALFASPSRQASAAKAAAAPAAPSPPPLPYRFAGRVVRDGMVQLFLAKGDIAIPINPGKILDDTYRVEAIGEDRITLVYLPLNHRESIALRHTPHTAAPGPIASADGQNEARLIDEFGRWTELSWEKRRQISEYLAQIPASPARDRLMQEYRRQVWGLQQ